MNGAMITLRDIMSTELVTVSPEMSLLELAEVFAARDISGAPVVTGDRLVGVVSTTDLLEFETSNPGAPRHRTDQTEWGEWGQSAEWSAGDDAPAFYFTEYWSDASADVAARVQQSEGPEWNRLAEHTVAEAMTTSVCSFPPDGSVQEAAQFMLAAGIHRVLIVEDEALIGLVTATDVMRAVAEHGVGGD